MGLLISALMYVLWLLSVIIIIRVVISWFMPVPRGGIENFTDFADAIIKPFRVVIPFGRAYLDLGPLLALIVIQLLAQVIARARF